MHQYLLNVTNSVQFIIMEQQTFQISTCFRKTPKQKYMLHIFIKMIYLEEDLLFEAGKRKHAIIKEDVNHFQVIMFSFIQSWNAKT